MMKTVYPEFKQRQMSFLGATKTVFQAGKGPAIIVMHEVPGLYPAVADFGRRVVASGFTVYMPSLFGEPGRAFGVPYTLQTLSRVCVSSEFTIFARRQTSPVTSWLRELAKHAHEECGGPGVGAVGMCLTGGFALAMMVDDRMLAPVLSQPSLPMPLSRSHSRDLGISDQDLARIKERAAAGQCVLGLRFNGDPLVPKQRFERLREELGDRFIAVEIDSSPGNPHGIRRGAHSVLTYDFVDEPGHPTKDALDQVIAFYRERLVQ